MNRRQFLQSSAALAITSRLAADVPPAAEPTAAKLPRWRGFNLLDKCYGQRNRPFKESDFALLAEWGFDFVRLPLSYRCWSEPDDLRIFAGASSETNRRGRRLWQEVWGACLLELSSRPGTVSILRRNQATCGTTKRFSTAARINGADSRNAIGVCRIRGSVSICSMNPPRSPRQTMCESSSGSWRPSANRIPGD